MSCGWKCPYEKQDHDMGLTGHRWDAAPSPALTREALYQAIRPEFRTEGPGGDKGWADARAAEITDRLLAALSKTPPPSEEERA